MSLSGYKKQPVSINTLTNFRERLEEYFKNTGIDLVQEEVEELSERIVKYLKINNKNIRMDSCIIMMHIIQKRLLL